MIAYPLSNGYYDHQHRKYLKQPPCLLKRKHSFEAHGAKEGRNSEEQKRPVHPTWLVVTAIIIPTTYGRGWVIRCFRPNFISKLLCLLTTTMPAMDAIVLPIEAPPSGIPIAHDVPIFPCDYLLNRLPRKAA